MNCTDAGGLIASKEFSLNVIGVIDLSGLVIEENVPGGSFGQLSITDPSFSNNVTYSLGGEDADQFEIVNGELKFKYYVSADYETKSAYSITVTAQDDQNNEAEISFSLSVGDVNEAPTSIGLSKSQTTTTSTTDTTNSSSQGNNTDNSTTASFGGFDFSDFGSFGIAAPPPAPVPAPPPPPPPPPPPDSSTTTSDEVTIDENEKGVVVGVLSTTDEDANDSFTYSLSGVNADNFEIQEDQLKLKEGKSVNFEENSEINLTVTSTDVGGLSKTRELSIPVNNKNDSPTNIRLSSNSVQDSLSGAIVGNLFVDDEDEEEIFTYSIDDNRFEIVEGVLKLKSEISVPESETNITFDITATDSGNEKISKTFSLIVGGVKLSTYNLDENAIGTDFGSLNVTGISSESGFTFSLSGEDARFFEITAEGTLKFKEAVSINYEGKDTYNILVKATNEDNLSVNGLMEIKVNNVLEPITDVYLEGTGRNSMYAEASEQYGPIFVIRVPENKPNAYLFSIGWQGEDSDSQYTQDAESFTFVAQTISGTNVSQYFTFDQTTGAVYLSMGSFIDYEDGPSLRDEGYLFHAGTNELKAEYVYDYWAGWEWAYYPLRFGLSDSSGNIKFFTVANSDTERYFGLDINDSPEDGSVEISYARTIFPDEIWSHPEADLVLTTLIGEGDFDGDGNKDIIGLLNSKSSASTSVVLIKGGNNITGGTNLGRIEGSINLGTDLTTLRSGDYSDIIYYPPAQNALVYLTTFPVGLSPSVAKMGDINGDGYSDVIIGLPTFSNTNMHQGAVLVLYGNANFNSLTTTAIWGPAQDWSSFGDTLDVGDFNGDGKDDIIVGAEWADSNPLFDEDEGVAYVFLGSSNLGSEVFASDAAFEHTAGVSDAETGSAVAAGDFNGDGIDDFAISSPSWSKSELFEDEVGKVEVFLGSTSGQFSRAFTVVGAIERDWIGEEPGKLEALGDINGDGYEDLAILGDELNIFFIWGRSSWSNKSEIDLRDDIDGVYASGAVWNTYSTYIQAAGDLNNDGLDDFVITDSDFAWESSQWNISGYSTSLIIYGSTTRKAVYDSLLTSGLEYLQVKGGKGSIALSDFDGDGFDDFLFIDESWTNAIGSDYLRILWGGYQNIDYTKPPPILFLESNKVLENVKGAIIGELRTDTSTLYPGETFTTVEVFSMADAGDNDADYFEVVFDESGDAFLKLLDNVSLNFEDAIADRGWNKNVSIRAYTSEGRYFGESFYIQLIDANDPPSLLITSDSSFKINNGESGSIVAKVAVSDEDPLDESSYTLSGVDSDKFVVLEDGSLKLKDGISADALIQKYYSLVVTGSDLAGSVSTQNVTIEINEVPSDLSISSKIVEENVQGAVVGTLSTKDDDDEGHSYEVSGTDAENFEVIGRELKLKYNVSFNFEEKSSYSISIKTTDSHGLSLSKDFEINVSNQNDAHSLSLSSTQVSENDAGAYVGTIGISDEDLNQNINSYSFEVLGTDGAKFEVEGTTLKLKSGEILDYELKNSYNITIYSTDNTGLEVQKSFKITASDNNDVPTDILISPEIKETVSEFRISTFEYSSQWYSEAEVLKDGSFVVVWQSWTQDGSDLGVYGQRFDSSGNKIDEEFQVNSYTNNHQAWPVVSALDNGGFLVNWHSWNQDGSRYGVYGQLFNSSGNKVGDEFQVHTNTSGSQSDPRIALLNDGNFVVTYNSVGLDGPDYGIAAQIFDQNGQKIGGEFLVNSSNALDQWRPDITHLQDGGFIITWLSKFGNAPNHGVMFQIFDQSGNKIGEEVQVSLGTLDEYYQYPFNPKIVQLNDGTLALTWLSEFTTNSEISSDGGNWFVVGALYSAQGSFIDDFVVNSDSNNLIPLSLQDYGQQFTRKDAPVISKLADGGFIVAWQSSDGSGTGLYGQLFDSTANKIGEKFLINSYTTLDQFLPSLTSLEGGSILATWSSEQDPDGWSIGVYGKIISYSGLQIEQNSPGYIIGKLSAIDQDSGEEFTFSISGSDAESFEIVDGKLKLKDGISADYSTKSSYNITITVTDKQGGTYSEDMTIEVTNPSSASGSSTNTSVTSINSNAITTDENSFTLPAQLPKGFNTEGSKVQSEVTTSLIDFDLLQESIATQEWPSITDLLVNSEDLEVDLSIFDNAPKENLYRELQLGGEVSSYSDSFLVDELIPPHDALGSTIFDINEII